MCYKVNRKIVHRRVENSIERISLLMLFHFETIMWSYWCRYTAPAIYKYVIYTNAECVSVYTYMPFTAEPRKIYSKPKIEHRHTHPLSKNIAIGVCVCVVLRRWERERVRGVSSVLQFRTFNVFHVTKNGPTRCSTVTWDEEIQWRQEKCLSSQFKLRTLDIRAKKI